MPTLAKPNCRLPYGCFDKTVVYDHLEGTNFVIYEMEDGKSASAPIYDEKADKVFELTAARSGNKIELSWNKTDAAFSVEVSNTGKKLSIAPGADGKAVIEL